MCVAREGQDGGECVRAAADTGRGGPLRLDQERDNRFGEWRSAVGDGDVVLSAARSGGSFDPLGRRAVDVWRADDLVAVFDACPGRWVCITLTVDRTAWTGPEVAYQRCQERVRRVMAEVCPSGVWFAALEMQTKTGDGWPHWHVAAWVPHETRSAGKGSELQAAVLKRWTTRTEHVDRDTGEVTVSVERIGFVDVQDVRSRRGMGRYLAKYIVKPWRAVPEWMGRSSRRFRKLRFSDATYDVLEKLHRHDRARGSRRPVRGRLRPARALFERMARSGGHCVAFRVGPDGCQFVGTIPCPIDAAVPLASERGGRVVQLGPWSRVRVAIAGEEFARLWRDSRSGALAERCALERRRWVFKQREVVGGAWARMQQEPEVADGLDAS